MLDFLKTVTKPTTGKGYTISASKVPLEKGKKCLTQKKIIMLFYLPESNTPSDLHKADI